MSTWGGLPRGEDLVTRREAEVAALVAEGLSNPAIAARLCVSKRTVGCHVEHILVKLGFRSRAQIAVWVTRKTQTPNDPSVDASPGRAEGR